MKKFLVIFIILTFVIQLNAQRKLRVACVGNSVTYGYLLPDRELNAYPSQLSQMLGDKYEVGNFGKSGATLLSKGHKPYIQQEEYKKALEFAADFVIIDLGLNDTDPRNWPNFRDDFVKDYTDLIASFRKAKPECEILICRLSPIFDRHPRFRSGTRDWYWQIQESIESIAVRCDAKLIDFQEVLYHYPHLFPDALHPNVEGATILAKTVYSAMTGDFGGLQMPLIYSDNMVLQRDVALPISGVANAGEKITVRIAKQTLTTTANSAGKWMVTLRPLLTGTTYVLSIEAKSRNLIYKNVLAGEVWLCSGQSNMAFMVKQSITSKDDILKSKHANIRFFDMKPRWDTSASEWDVSVLDSLNRLQYFKKTQWTECNSTTIANFSAVAYHFGNVLADSLNVPIGLISNAIGGSPCEAWIDRRTLEFDLPDILENWKQNDMIQDWVRGRATVNIKNAENKLQRHPYEPCYLFESAIVPLAHFPIKGVIWYQGESNAQNIEIHEKLFELFVGSFRKFWNNDKLPVYYVQLSSLNRPGWPRFRDSQRRIMKKIPEVYMAVSSDKGDSLNVHPIYKREIGERLAYWALNKSYFKPIIPSGPLFRSVEFVRNFALLTFDYASNLHSSDGKPLLTFEIAEVDGLFFPAEAIVIGEQIKLTAKQVANPRFVRYGWQPFTRANLVNGNELPASTFCSQ